jgi:hypothetical protein
MPAHPCPVEAILSALLEHGEHCVQMEMDDETLRQHQRLCLRRQFMRNFPFFAQPWGRAFRWRCVHLQGSVALVQLLLATTACAWVFWAYSGKEATPDGPQLGQLSLRTFWLAQVPPSQAILRWLQVMSLLTYSAVNTLRRWASLASLAESTVRCRVL